MVKDTLHRVLSEPYRPMTAQRYLYLKHTRLAVPEPAELQEYAALLAWERSATRMQTWRAAK